MANDSTSAGQVASEPDSTQIQDGYFTDMQGEDVFFGPEQLAQAGAGGAPVVVPVPQDQNVIRVQVTPGEILELSAPFDSGAALLGREADGNLAIRVGDITVILVGFVEANSTAPLVVQTSDGQPIDIAVLLASTDPAIDIQTAAGPGDAGQGGQGADNTGAILAQLGEGNGLGGLNAVGAQDQTELSYRNIDNAIRLDREDALAAVASGGLGRFPGVAEPFLRDPFHTNSAAWLSFDDFKAEYATYIDAHKADKGGWADFTGTQATTDDSAAFFLDTSYVVEIPHSSATPEQLNLLAGSDFFHGDVPTSNGETLEAHYLGGAFGDQSTIVLVRPSDGAVVMVFHVQEQDGTGNFHVEVYLVNRLDHHGDGQDVLTVGFNTEVYTPPAEGEESQGSKQPGPNGSVDIQDDIPVTGETDYYSFLHATSFKDAAECFSVFLGGKISDYVTTHDAGHVDEDFIFHGNRDKDNPLGPDSDADRGDDIGDRFVVGMLNIDFGADGPSGKIPEGDKATKDDPIFHDANPPALKIDDLNVGDAYPDAKSNGHDLFVLKHEMLPFPFSTVEVIQVGYTLVDDSPSGEAALSGAKSCDVVVFTLLLQTGPNLPLFGGFVFEQSAPLDHDPAATLESNLLLDFQITATDDDGDHPIDPVTIHIQVNDDAPTFQITYDNEDPRNCDVREEVSTFSGGDGGYVDHYTTKDFGHVDEDWLNGGIRNDGIKLANGPGNHDQDGNGDDNANLYGDDKGGLEVCGQIKVKYGADGPSDTPGELALKTYNVPASGPAPLFVNGDGTPLTSDGKPLVVFVSTAGHLQVGVDLQVFPGKGEGGSILFIPGQIVFDLTLDPSTGKFDFQLFGAIDHLPSTVAGQPESNLVLSFNVGSAEDFDHDKVLGAINIKVNDDKPEVGITYYNELPGTYALVGFPTKSDTDFGRIDEDWLQGPGENGALVTVGNQDRDALFGGNANQFGDDYGSYKLSGDISMKFGADGPGSQALGLATLSGPFKDAADQALSSGGHPLTVISSSATSLVIGYGTTHVLELTLNTSTGHFDFKQLMPLDHPIHSTIEDNIYLAFNAGSITDGDGDTVAAIIKIQVNDDVPETAVTYGGEVPAGLVGIEAIAAYGQADEDWLTSGPTYGNQDADNSTPGDPSDPARGDEAGNTIVTGTLGGTKYGADGPAGTPTHAFALTGLAAGSPFTDAGGNPVESHGNPLVVLSSNGTLLTVGYHNGSDPDTTVLELSMTDPTHFKFELKGPLDDPQDGGALEDGLLLMFLAADQGAPTDKDGDPAARIIIHVNDDAPRFCETDYTSFQSTEEDAPVITSTAFGQVDEDYPGTATANTDNDNDPFSHQDADRGDTYGTTSCYGTFVIDFGADGPADNPYSLEALGVGTLLSDNDGNPLKSHDTQLQVLTCSATGMTVGYVAGSPATSHLVYEVTLDQSTGNFTFSLYDSLDHPTQDPKAPVENNLMLGFNVVATDFDGDSVSTRVNIQVNDDAPLAAPNTDPNSTYAGNVVTDLNDDGKFDYLGADGASVTNVASDLDGEAVTKNSSSVIESSLGYLTMAADGTWTYEPKAGQAGGEDVFTYTLTDGDGDTSSTTLKITVEPTGVASRVADLSSIHDSFDLTLTVTKNTDATTHVNYHDGDNVKIEDTSTGFLGIGAGHTLKGGSGDDLIFGNDGADHIYGRAGHDAQSGGAGADEFHDVDAADLDGSHTLDGIHSIDGGDGYDTVDLGGLKTFDSSQAARIENVEALNFDGKPADADGTQVTLTYDAAYGITQVGGIHLLNISGDAGKDTVNLIASSGKSWVSDGEVLGVQFFHAGSGGDKVTVTVEHDVAVQLS